MLRGLAELTGESANLAVLTQGRAEYVAQAPGRHTMRTFTEVGNRVELHCTGVGKALLAAADPPQAGRLIATAPLAAQTPATITDTAALQAEIALIRDRGYALDEGEMEIGVRCVAVGLPGATPMAVSVSGPAVRMTDALVRRRGVRAPHGGGGTAPLARLGRDSGRCQPVGANCLMPGGPRRPSWGRPCARRR